MSDEKESQDFEIVKELGELPASSVVTEEALAKLFNRHPVSIKRAVERGELPPAVRLFGKPIWTTQIIRDHLSKRLVQAQKEAESLERKISQYST